MSLREDYLSGFDLETVRALEFGPMDKPWVPRSTPGVRNIDHLSLQELKEKVTGSPFYDPEKLCRIHYVNDGSPLREILKDWDNLDLIVASHVLEHIPNLIGWLQDLASVLASDGRLLLAIPDKRYVFDYFRPITTLQDVLSDFIEDRTKPSSRAIFGHLFHAVQYNNNISWGEEVDPSSLSHCHTLEESYRAAATHGTATGEYMDVHVSVFTPYSFVKLLEGLTKLRLLPFELERIDPSGMEFLAILQTCPAEEQIEERLESLASTAAKLPFNPENYFAGEFVQKEPRYHDLTTAELSTLKTQLSQTADELNRLKNSFSWRVTKPLRDIRGRFQ